MFIRSFDHKKIVSSLPCHLPPSFQTLKTSPIVLNFSKSRRNAPSVTHPPCIWIGPARHRPKRSALLPPSGGRKHRAVAYPGTTSSMVLLLSMAKHISNFIQAEYALLHVLLQDGCSYSSYKKLTYSSCGSFMAHHFSMHFTEATAAGEGGMSIFRVPNTFVHINQIMFDKSLGVCSGPRRGFAAENGTRSQLHNATASLPPAVTRTSSSTSTSIFVAMPCM